MTEEVKSEEGTDVLVREIGRMLCGGKHNTNSYVVSSKGLVSSKW